MDMSHMPLLYSLGFCRDRRGSKSCLKVSSTDESGSLSPSGLPSPARRRSVHFDTSPAATVEVPASEADKAQRGCGALIGPAPFSGKEVYVAPQPMEDEDDQDEETQRLVLARDIARRQSGGQPALSPDKTLL